MAVSVAPYDYLLKQNGFYLLKQDGGRLIIRANAVVPDPLVPGLLSGPTSVTKSRLNGFTATAPTGTTGTVLYQAQQKRTIDSIWQDVPGETSLAFDVRNLLASTEYQVRQAQTDDTGTVYTNTITATTIAAPTPEPGEDEDDDMASFPGLVLYYEPVVFNKDLGGPGCMWGLRVAAAGTVVARQRDGVDMSFVLTAPGNIQGDFIAVISAGTDVAEEDITVARR